MPMIRPVFLSERVRVVPPISADPIRYNYLNLQNAEPNLGIPTYDALNAYDTFVVTTNLTGGRSLQKTLIWDDTYTTLLQNSGTWLTKGIADTFYFPLSGGEIDGDVYVFGGIFATGGLSAVSAQYFITTLTGVTSLSVQSFGYEPALFVGAAGGSFDLAVFKDVDNGIEVMRIKDAHGTGRGRVGINTANPLHELTVIGSLSTSEVIYVANNNSNQYTSTFNTTRTTSATWTDTYTTVRNFSASWEESAEIIPTVTNYLSTNNVRIRNLTVTDGVSVRGGLSADRIVGTFNNNIIDAFIGDGTTTIFNLTQTVASVNNILVYVGGIYQDKATYSIAEGPPPQITFTQAPPAPDIPLEPNIEIVYLQANPMTIGTVADASITTQKIADKAITSSKLANNLTVFGSLSVVGTLSASNYILTQSYIPYQTFNVTPGQTVFNLLCAAASVNDINVFVSGVYQNKNNYVLTDHYTLVFSQPPPEGIDIVEVIYSRPFPATAAYPFFGSVIESSIANFAVTTPKLATDAVTTEKISNASITSDKLLDDLNLVNVRIQNLTGVNTVFSLTSALSVIRNSTNMALYVGASASNILTKVGVNTRNPSTELTVHGTISASGNITSPGLNATMFSTALIFG